MLYNQWKMEVRTMDEIRVECSLTERQYRNYMKYHVLGNRRDVLRHAILCLLIAAFGLVNFSAKSPLLGWIFVTLAIYLFVSRYLRFYMSVNRIVEQFGLSDTPKYFYTLTFHSRDFEVKNQKEHAKYSYDRIVRTHFNDEQNILYLYLTKSSAFLLPYDGIQGKSAQDLKDLLTAKAPAENPASGKLLSGKAPVGKT